MLNRKNRMKPKQVDPAKVIQLVAALNAAIWLVLIGLVINFIFCWKTAANQKETEGN